MTPDPRLWVGSWVTTPDPRLSEAPTPDPRLWVGSWVTTPDSKLSAATTPDPRLWVGSWVTTPDPRLSEAPTPDPRLWVGSWVTTPDPSPTRDIHLGLRSHSIGVMGNSRRGRRYFDPSVLRDLGSISRQQTKSPFQILLVTAHLNSQ